jgi:putative alpha-1,2-mannosidase
MHLPNGKDFVVDAPKSSRDAKYVASATIGGRPLAGTAIPHASVVSGETLRLEMTAE